MSLSSLPLIGSGVGLLACCLMGLLAYCGGVGPLACCVVGVLADCAVGMLACCLMGLLTCCSGVGLIFSNSACVSEPLAGPTEGWAGERNQNQTPHFVQVCFGLDMKSNLPK